MRKKKQTHYRSGLMAENIAAFYFICKGYRILARRYKTPMGEIDIIARRGKTIAMTEVKLRAHLSDSLESIHKKNQKRIEKAAQHFLVKHPKYNYSYTIRFDVIAINSGWMMPFRITHLDNAWQTSA